MHQPVLSFSEEVNFHASGWTMWTQSGFFLLKTPRRVHSLSHGDTKKKGGTRSDESTKKKKKITKTERTERRGEREMEDLRPQDHYFQNDKACSLVLSFPPFVSVLSPRSGPSGVKSEQYCR